MAIAMALLMINLCVFAAGPLDRGTILSVRLTADATSKKSSAPTAIVDNDVKAKDGSVLIKRGTPVQLQVIKEKARGCGRAGTVTVKCVSTTATDGQTVSLEGSLSEEGNNKKGLAIGLGVGMGVLVLPGVGFAFLAIKGGDAVIPSNTLIPNVLVMNDYEIQ